MDKTLLLWMLLLVSLSSSLIFAQEKLPREYIPEGELVVLSSGLPIQDALDILSEYALEFSHKPIYNPMKLSGEIGIDIRSLPWQKALEIILSKRGLWFSEREHFFEVVQMDKKSSTEPSYEADFVELDGGKTIDLGAEGVKIEAIFFQASRKTIREWGIDWSTFSNGKIDVRADQLGSAPLSDDMLSVLVGIPKSVAKVDVTALLRTFEANNVGEVLAQPQIVVTEGQIGKIQVGEDFSIKTRDFAGNIIDKFFSTGTILQVTPYVIAEDGKKYIFLEVKVERSAAYPDVVSTIIKKSEASSFVELYDGEQTIIAGLYNNETATLRKGIPFLKDLPWWFFGIRYLFGYDRKQVDQIELVILLKASVLPDVRDRKTKGASSFELKIPNGQQESNIEETKNILKQTQESRRQEVDIQELKNIYVKGKVNMIRNGIALLDMGQNFNVNKMVQNSLAVIRNIDKDKNIRVGTLKIIKANNNLAAAKIIQELNDYKVQQGDEVVAQLYKK